MGFPVFKQYFESAKACKDHALFTEFFNDKKMLPWLMILHKLACHYEKTVLAIEGKEITLLPALHEFRKLQDQVKQFETEKMVPQAVLNDCMAEWTLAEKEQFKEQVQIVYHECWQYMFNLEACRPGFGL